MDRFIQLVTELTLIQLSYAVSAVLILFLIYLIFALCAYVPLLRRVINYHMDQNKNWVLIFPSAGAESASSLFSQLRLKKQVKKEMTLNNS